MTHGILLVNLGTPKSPHKKDVKRYLQEFLTDGRVIDLPFLQRQFLVRGLIVPRRYRASAKLYQSIWTNKGSPLLVYGKEVETLLQKAMGKKYIVRLAMRYQSPSIEQGLHELQGVEKLTIFPLFPQYASATTGSVYEKVFKILRRWQIIPSIRFISHYEQHPALIRAFAMVANMYPIKKYDHILFSYHGLPERQIKKADRTGLCLKDKACCTKNSFCYVSQCSATTQEITKKLQIPNGKWSQCFQSRLGKSPWIQPYTSNVLEDLALKGCKNILVFCPAFVCDCLETLEEIKVTYQKEFQEKGGEKLELVRGLNNHPEWIKAMQEIICDPHS